MASSFAFHPTVNEVVPYSARYAFPSQATRQSKRTVKITPKNNATTFASGSTIRFEFPASGYLNPNNTYLAFNARFNATTGSFVGGTDTPTASNNGGFEFQQNIASIFRRVRILYGSLVLEDIQDYNILQRMFTEITLPSGTADSGATMLQGIGPHRLAANQLTTATTAVASRPFPFDAYQSRYNYHSNGDAQGTYGTATPEVAATVGAIPRRYAIPIATGLFQQHNLLPLKFMASQLQVELEIADAIDCCVWTLGTGGTPSVPTNGQVLVGLPELVTELLEFDSEFDAAVYDILGTGLPIYFQSWHVTTQTVQPNLTNQLNIQETARSVRYALAAMLDDSLRTLRTDAHIFLGGLQTLDTSGLQTNQDPNKNCQVSINSLIESYQWRLGGTYYPSQPVPCYSGTTVSTTAVGVDANYADPPVEAQMELMKVFGNLFADDGTYFGDNWVSIFGETRRDTAGTSRVRTKSFIIAGNFMSDRGDVISGINAEEQNDLQLILKFVGTSGATAKTIKIAVCYDNLIILGENNNMVLVN